MRFYQKYLAPLVRNDVVQIPQPGWMSWLFWLLLASWGVLLYLGVFVAGYSTPVSQFAAESEFVVHLFILISSYCIYRDASTRDRKTLLWFILINMGLFLNDFTFYVMVYLQNTLLTNTAFLVFVVNFVPLLIWIISSLVFLSRTLLRNILQVRIFLKLLLFFTVINFAIIYLFLESINYAFPIFTWQSMSQIVLVCMQLLIFDCIILCLIYSENKGFSYFIAGLTILISGNLFVVYSVSSQTSNLLIYGELLWFLGLIFMMFGCWMIDTKKLYGMEEWFRHSDAIKSRLVFWSFGTSITSFLLFFVISYLFSIVDSRVLSGLPFFIMIYSIIVVGFALFMGKTFEEPFKKIERNIRALMFDEDRVKINSEFETEEFRFLQKFILDAYEHKEAKDRVKKRLGEITAQVAHDIKSPTAALLVLSKTCTDMQESDRIALREAAHTIQDIANNVLNQYRVGGETDVESETVKEQEVLLSGLILEVLSEKRLQYRDYPVDFEANLDQEAEFAFINGEQTSLKRMLSNLINNAVEAGDEDVRVRLILSVGQGEVKLVVKDNGRGISAELIQKITAREAVSSDKVLGHGIGLLQVHQVLAECGAHMEVESAPVLGTEVILSFPQLPTPHWIASQMLLAADAIVLVLDDDGSIHTAWDHCLKAVVAASPALQVVHFKEGQAVINYVNNLSGAEKQRLFLLTDYELLKQSLNGLDVLEQAKIKNSILVTSHYTSAAVLERARSLGAKVLPKLLVAALPIALKAESTPVAEAVDVVIVDDQEQFMRLLANYYLKDKNVQLYGNPHDFLAELEAYAKDVPICLDDDFGLPDLSGRDLAEVLYQKGYTRLYLISGMQFDDLPEYLVSLEKNQISTIFR